ncbi:MAG: alpha-galactosidase [Clostridiales bacterium]|jgi:alpha-galactosidase|nr:alpha-galactosidase [Clostridiales bacterium]
MFENPILSIKYLAGGVEKTAATSTDDLTVKQEFKNGVFDLRIDTKTPITVKEISLTEKYDFKENALFFGNGFQSWTDTKEYSVSDKMRDIGIVGKDMSKFQFWQRLMGMGGASLLKRQAPTPIGPIYVHAGDYGFAKYDTKRTGYFHSISYTYIRNGGDYTLVGSLNERTGYTVIYADMNVGTLTVEKDLEGIVIDGSYHVFSLFTANGSYDGVFDAYFGKIGAKPRTGDYLKGYTSWYNYYSNIKEEIILRDLDAIAAAAPEINTFQIDDGYQTAVGDWLSIDPKKFPNGMKVIADAVHKKGLNAGIWLAPFAAQLNSKVLKEHPDWFIKNPDGSNRVIGHNWGGFCGINPYNKEARAHIKGVFDVVLNQWGYDLVKLDFLYAAGAVPVENKTRAECMYDAMEFIRSCVGGKKILGCGVPMLPCVNQVEYMRIGADMGLSWSQALYGMVTDREDVNTRNAIHNGINRRHLNKRVFLNDPDVFLLRDYNIRLSFSKRKLLAKLIKLTGGVLFTSDDLSRYGDEQKACLKYMLSDTDITIQDVTFKSNIYTVSYTENGEKQVLQFNLKNGAVSEGITCR